MPDIRVLIVAGDPLARAGLATLLANQPGCTITGQVADNTGIGDAVNIYRPDVVLWDLGMDISTARERILDFRNLVPGVVALVSTEADASQVWAMGPRGILLRDAEPARIASALRATVERLTVVDPALVPMLLPTRGPLPLVPADELTPRERQVLQLLAQGQSNKEIARRLEISEHTVKFHMNSILGKLHVQSRTEAVVQATRLGLVLL